jgi:hypothetical protein
MITKKIAGQIALLSIIVSLFSMGVASAQSGCVTSSNGAQFCPISSSYFYNQVSQGVQQNAVSAVGGISNFTSLLVPAMFVLLILVLAYIIFIKLIQPFLK